jgi:hypothetical protein
MATGQPNLVKLLSKSEEEFCIFFIFPITKVVSPISGFENDKLRKIFILQRGFISPVNNFFTHSPPDETEVWQVFHLLPWVEDFQ